MSTQPSKSKTPGGNRGTWRMPAFDAFIYNFLAMGVIFPWIYVWGPSSFPGGSLELGILLTFVAQLPISLAYCFLASALPYSGGDYLYQSRAFGKWGFVSVMSGFVFWILQWIAISGWLFANLGLAPLMLCLGVFTGSKVFVSAALMIQSQWGVTIISLMLALCTVIFLTRGGMRLYVRVQRVLFALTIVSIVAIIVIFAAADFAARLNEFVLKLGDLNEGTKLHTRGEPFVQFLIADIRNSGLNLSVPFSWLATLGMVPIAWTSLYSAAWGVQQNGEISGANRFWVQFRVIVLSSLAVAVGLCAVAYFERGAITQELVTAASAAYWQDRGSPETVRFIKEVLRPFPNVLAMVASGSVFVSALIALGFLANGFQVTCNCFVGVSRILISMGNDRVLPRSLRLGGGEANEVRLVRAHWLYLIAAVPLIVCYNMVPGWENYSLGVTFALGYVYTLSALAATRLCGKKLNAALCESRISGRWRVAINVVGYAGFASGLTMVLAYLLWPQLGLTGMLTYLVVLGIVLVSFVIYEWSDTQPDVAEGRLRYLPEVSAEPGRADAGD